MVFLLYNHLWGLLSISGTEKPNFWHLSTKHRENVFIYLQLHIHNDKPVVPTSKEVKFNLICAICMMWKSFLSIPGLEFMFILSLSIFLLLASSFPQSKLGQAGAQRNQDMANWVFQACFGGRQKAALQKSYFSSWDFINPRATRAEAQEEAGPALGSSARSMAAHGTGISPAGQCSIFTRGTNFWEKNSQGFDLAGSGMWLHLLSHHALWKDSVGSDDKGLSQLWILCSFLLFMGFIPPYFAYLTSQIPEDPLPRAILLILIANNHILVCWRQEVPSCSFRDCWALIVFYVTPVKCSWFHCEGELMHRE